MLHQPGPPPPPRNRCFSLAALFSAVFFSLLGRPPAVGATHYPPGSLCYDCHAVSGSKMVQGTHLIKKSQKTVDLGITFGVLPCLFCHEDDAVSVRSLDRDRMKGVWNHFRAASASKHEADFKSTLTPNPEKFGCLDCHRNITEGVSADGAGNANVHGKDASSQLLLVKDTFRTGSPLADLSDAEVSGKVCGRADCHGGAADNPLGTSGFVAKKAHGFTKSVTLPQSSGTRVAAYCTECHGKHNSYLGSSLLVLKTDGTTGDGSDAQTLVTPEKCPSCHSQDDAGVYASKGHGRSAILGGTLSCTSCHSSAVPHGFTFESPSNPLRFAFQEKTDKQSALRRQPPYNQAYSLCLTCHGQFANKLHQTSSASTTPAGCNDCHEPHGAGVGTNVKMIRSQIPKVSPSGAAVYGDATAGFVAYDPITYASSTDDYRADGTGLCDNAECHAGRTTARGEAAWPLSTLMTAGRHTGGNLSAGADCAFCHKHTDAAGSWAATDSCTSCHGEPPAGNTSTASGYLTFFEATTPHSLHAGASGYGFACDACHGNTLANGTHRTSVPSYRDVRFDQFSGSDGQTLNPSATYTSATWTCSQLYCHSTGASRASVGTAKWMAAAPSTPSAPPTCHGCHGGVDAGATQIATGLHPLHLTTWTGTGTAAITCASCHGATLSTVGTDSTTTITGKGFHVNGVKDVVAGGSFNGTSVSFTYTGGNCATISCHGAFKDVGWNAAPGHCDNCHGTFGTTAAGIPMETTVEARHSGVLSNPDGDAGTTLYNSHQGTASLGTNGEGRCDFCHANQQAAYTPSMHLDGKVQLNSAQGYQGDSTGTRGAGSYGCTDSCHRGSLPYQMTDTGRPLEPIAGTPTTCVSCHTGTADRDNYNGQDTVPSRLSAVEYNTVGHGAKGVECAGCHETSDVTAPHDTTSGLTGPNPFRLKDQDGAASGVQFRCSYNGSGCHSGTPTASVATVKTHSAAEMANASYATRYPWSFAPDCLNCHDPHGDGQNLAMVRKQLYDKTPYPALGPPPEAPSGQPDLVFSNKTGVGANSYAWGAAQTPNFGGLCQGCHEGTPGVTTTKGFVDAVSANYLGHYGYAGSTTDSPGDCTTCHRHFEGFKPGGCNSCHGSVATGQFWPSAVAYPNRSGSHLTHVEAIAAAAYGPSATVSQKNTTCNWCHPNPGSPRLGTGESGHDFNAAPTGAADMHGDGRTGASATSFKDLAGALDEGGTYDNATKTCAVNCHGRILTPGWGTTAAAWDSSAPTASAAAVNGTQASANLALGTATATLTATISDTATGGSNVVGAEYSIDDLGAAGTGSPMGAQDGAFNSPAETVTATVDTSAWTVLGSSHVVYVRGRDAAGNWGAAGSVTVTLVAKNTFSVAAASAPSTVVPGQSNVLMQRLTFTAAAGMTANLSSLQVQGTTTASVAAVRVYRDNGVTSGAWDASDTLLGTGQFNSSNLAGVTFPTEVTVASGSPVSLLVTYDLSSQAAGGSVTESLTAVGFRATDSLTTALPLAGATATLSTVPTFTPSGVATPASWIAVGGTWAAVMDGADGATSYGNAGTAATTAMQVDFDDPSAALLASTLPITSVTVTLSARRTGASGYIAVTLYLGAVPSTTWMPTPTASFATYSSTFPTRPGGGAWTWTDIQNLRIYVAQSLATTGAQVSQLVFTVSVADTTPPSATAGSLKLNNTATPSVQQGTSTPLTFTANVTDTQSNVVYAEVFDDAIPGNGLGVPLTPQDGSFNAKTEDVTGTLSPAAWTPGTRTLYLGARDAAGNWMSTYGSLAVTVTPRNSFTVTGTPGSAGPVLAGELNAPLEKLTFAASLGTPVISGLRFAVTQDQGNTGTGYLDVTQVKVFDDSGPSSVGQWGADDTLLGAGNVSWSVSEQ